MAEPASDDRATEAGADIASTDTSQAPGSRDETTQAVFGEGGSTLPVEPATEAIRRLEGELEELRDRHARLAAEFDNYRKRTTRERGELGDRAQAALFSRLLDVLDDMERLVADGSGSLDALREGVKLVDRKFRKELEAAGVERIDPAGQPFDPQLHEAISTAPAPSPELEQQVSATFQAGYRFKGILVRPARVQVYSEKGHA